VGLGIRLAEGDEGGGFKVDTVNADSPAAKAGVKVGDHLVKIEGAAVTTRGSINDLLADKKVGDVVLLSLKRDGKDVEVRATLAAEQGGGGRRGGGMGGGGGGFGGRGGGWDDRLPGAWKRDVYRLAIIGIEYPDVKHNSKVSAKDWTTSIFSKSE